MDIEKRNDIVFGMFDLGQDVDGMAIGSFDYIKKDIMDIKTSYIRLGFHLAECKTCKYYEKFGYVDFNEFVFNNFGLDKYLTFGMMLFIGKKVIHLGCILG